MSNLSQYLENAITIASSHVDDAKVQAEKDWLHYLAIRESGDESLRAGYLDKAYTSTEALQAKAKLLESLKTYQPYLMQNAEAVRREVDGLLKSKRPISSDEEPAESFRKS